jgi:hypothetical protein
MQKSEDSVPSSAINIGTPRLHRYFGHMNILQPKRIAFSRLPPRRDARRPLDCTVEEAASLIDAALIPEAMHSKSGASSYPDSTITRIWAQSFFDPGGTPCSD